MPKSTDLLGLIIDTSLVPADDDPGFDDKGYIALRVPEDNNPADEDEDDAAFKGLLDSGLSQEEAQEAVDFMRPLDRDEREILEEEPGLEGITRVDDAEHDEWLGRKASEGHNAIDRALEDAVYGDNTMAHDEEGMERNDTDSGWGWKSPFRSLKKGLKKAGGLAMKPVSMSARIAKRGVSMPFSIAKRGFGMMAKSFIPSRDGNKAAMVKSLYRKLWFEHANWLAAQDQGAGRPLQPRANYEAAAKDWARNEISKQGLPIQYAVDTSSGSEMGAWFWPFSWFQGKTQTVLANTADARSPDAPAGQPAQAPAGMDPSMISPDAAPMDPSTDPSMASPPPEGDPGVQGWNGVRGLKGHGVLGEDSLGAFAMQILGDARPPAGRDAAQPAKDNPHAERIVRAIALKLKARKPISPGELGLLSSAAKEGNVDAQKVLVVLESRGVAVSGDESGLDPWMYKLNPMYWIASKRKQDLIDIEKKKWDENYQLQKRLAKQKEVLDQAERAAQATQAVAAAQAQSAATEAQLREIEASLKGAMSGSSVGHEKITPVSDVVVAALDKAGKREEAGRLCSKIKAGQPLDEGELKEANKIAKIIGRMRVVHGDLVESSEETLRMHGDFIGACILGGIGAAKVINVQDMQIADKISKKLASGQSLTPAERDALVRVLKDQKKLRAFTASLVSGDAFAGCPQKKTWARGTFVGAMKAMSAEDKKMLSAIVKLAKVGNPRAQKALKMMRESGEVMGGDVMGFGIKKFFHYATAPIWLPAKGIYKGEQALFGSKGSNPEQIRLAKMKAAYKRKQAAQARANAADAQTEAEQRAQQAIADAADAEADAADATAFSKEQKMKTAEAEANPDSIPTAAGSFVGGWTDMIGKGTKAHKIVSKASEKSPTGTKIRAGATLYAKSRKGDPKARKALKIMVIKAKKGDQQAIRDLNAVKAGRIAVKARAKAKRRQRVAQARAVRRAKVVSAQRGFEARAAEQLSRMSRKHELRKLSRVERKAARGDRKCKAFIAKRIVASKQGDKKAKAQVQGMKLMRKVRLATPSRRERQNMNFAISMANRLKRNDPKAIRQLRIYQAAASRGNPNAIRCLQRLALAGAMVTTIATGTVVQPKKFASGKKAKRQRLVPGTPAYARAQRQVASAKAKAAKNLACREELAASARTAHQLGDNESAGYLAQKAATAPSQTESLKKEAARVAAAQSGNPEAQAALDKSLEGAKAGKVEDIASMGKVMAVKTIDQANKGEPISPTMRDAINLQARAQAGDPVAQDALRRVSEAATQPNPAPDAVLAATASVAAASIGTALANKPKAKQQLMEQVNPPIPPAEKGTAEAEVAAIVAKANEGTATPEEGARGIELAQRLGKPRIAAEIAAKAPPYDPPASLAMSSLPDSPLPPIQGAGTLLKESLKAVTFSTRDPLANYREGVAARSKDAAVATASPAATSSGAWWSPFTSFLQKASPAASMTAAVASVATLARTRGGRGASPAPAPASAPTPAVAAPPATKAPTTATAGAFVGSSDSYKDLIAAALRSKKMSKADFNRAVNASAGPDAPPFAKKALGEQTLKFLQSKSVTVGDDFSSGRPHPTFRQARRNYERDIENTRKAEQQVSPDKRERYEQHIRWDQDQERRLNLAQTSHHLHDDDSLGAFVGTFVGKYAPHNPRLPKPGHTKSHGDDSSCGRPGHRPTYHPGDPQYRTHGDNSLGAFVGTFVGKSDEFKQLIIAALKAKKMSKADFNKAVEAHVKPGATKEEKTAAGEKMLHFLTAKKVTIS